MNFLSSNVSSETGELFNTFNAESLQITVTRHPQTMQIRIDKLIQMLNSLLIDR